MALFQDTMKDMGEQEMNKVLSGNSWAEASSCIG
jgi:hypothetical protein